MAAHVLVVDDDPAERRRIEQILKDLGHSVESAESGEAALQRLQQFKLQPIAAMILDLVMPELDGMAVLERLTRLGLSVPVIVQTAPGSADAGASAMRAGAFDFLVKPASPERIRASLANTFKMGTLADEILKMRLGRAGTLGLEDIAIRSTAMERVRQLAERATRSSIPVLIEGERGVGKEFLARAIHASSTRRTRPFVALHCDSNDALALESALAGYREGNAPLGGKLVEAAGGTLFLDEIGALGDAAQATLAAMLAAADDHATAKPHALPGDVRLVAATSRRLIDRVAQKQFRQELFNRLNVLTIWVPPLRQRRADISALAERCLVRIAAEAKRQDVVGIGAAAMERLIGHHWPANIRELEQTIFRAVMLSTGGELQANDFPTLAIPGPVTAYSDRTPDAIVAQRLAVADQKHSGSEAASATSPPTDRPLLARYGVARLLDERGEMRPFEVLEEEVIRFAIDHYSGRMSEVARRLGIGRSTLYRKIKDYGIDPEQTVAP